MIDLHYWPTPNGHKVTMFLEEAGLPYTLKPVDIGNGAQFDPDFLRIAPNNKMPAIVDHAPADGGEPVAMFESGAILLYLADKTGRFLGDGAGDDAATALRKRLDAQQWLFWQMAGLGPMTGQYGHFHVYAPEDVPYARERYRNEAARLLSVLDTRLADREFIAGDAYSIADMAAYPWIDPYDRAPMDLSGLAHLRRWRAAVAGRPATQRAYALSTQVNPDAGRPLSEAEKKILFGQRPR